MITEVKVPIDITVKSDPNYKGYTPLHLAVRNDKTEVVEFLVSNGAKLNALSGENCGNSRAFEPQCYSPIHMAIIAKSVPMITYLRSKGASLKAHGLYTKPPVHFAVASSREVLKYFLDLGLANSRMDHFAGGKTVLHFAAMGNDVELVKMLVIDYNADMSVRDKDGKTPLDVARNYHIIKFLRNPYA